MKRPSSTTRAMRGVDLGAQRRERRPGVEQGYGHRRSLPAVPVPLFDTSAARVPTRRDPRVIGGSSTTVATSSGRRRCLETEFAAYVGAEHAIGVANGTDALTIALRAMGVGPGDEVVVPSFTFYASAEAIPPTGARPVFCDVDPDTYCVTPRPSRRP